MDSLNTTVSIGNLKEAVALGSPTAQKLLDQIQREIKTLADEKVAQAQAATEQMRSAQSERVQEIQTTINAALLQYDVHRVEAEKALLQAFNAAKLMPAGVEPRPTFQHLRRVHLPPSVLGPMDPLFPAFTSMECLLMTIER
jgi:formate dehydrogenase maturation protein FdhE